ncbi:hypothetical protein [Streptomyces viridosporus]|uniref:hypothetical protein n=1 Tax=Streptomyces viridosporus TaxID=67581 RepID=UPI0036F783EE
MRLHSGRLQKADDRPEAPATTPGLAVELRGVRRRYGRGAGAVHALAVTLPARAVLRRWS